MGQSFKSWNCILLVIFILLVPVGCKKISGVHEVAIPPPPTITDIDGNDYKTVTIGTQVWLTSNLKTTKLNDGTPIPLITDNNAWGNGGLSYCWYNNDAGTYKGTYGALYNCYTTNIGKLCPIGWHVPSDDEWTKLITFLGDNPGGKLKETGYIHWSVPNFGATNYSGFTAVPGGQRFPDGTFYGINILSYWWSATPTEWRYIGSLTSTIYNDGSIGLYQQRTDYGFSVRCIMN
jgi:uncharacterized protein (TIGR02145 family)